MPTWSQRTTLYQSNKITVFRVLDTETQKTWIIKSLPQEHPDSSEIARFHHETEILAHLGPTEGILQAQGKILYQGYPSVLFPDLGAVSLTQLLTEPMKIGVFLHCAIFLAESLGRIHSKGVVHKDINPSNIISLPDFSKVWIIDFSIASLTHREVQHLKPVQYLEGTLHYLAPEQSGRINRSLDYRADFYSLGITFFELLTGTRPFNSTDIMELLHSHLVEPLPNIHQMRNDAPQSLVEVIQKLVAKDPDHRYQSTWGLVSDLKKIQKAVSQDKNSWTFPLGQEDLSEYLIIPEKVYGREKEVSEFLQIFENCQKIDAPENSFFTLIEGSSGVGKSSLIRELIRPVSERGGYLVEGKIDQFQSTIPLFGFKKALLLFLIFLPGIPFKLWTKLRMNSGKI